MHGEWCAMEDVVTSWSGRVWVDRCKLVKIGEFESLSSLLLLLFMSCCHCIGNWHLITTFLHEFTGSGMLNVSDGVLHLPKWCLQFCSYGHSDAVTLGYKLAQAFTAQHRCRCNMSSVVCRRQQVHVLTVNQTLIVVCNATSDVVALTRRSMTSFLSDVTSADVSVDTIRQCGPTGTRWVDLILDQSFCK